jgi:hypothetical protein
MSSFELGMCPPPFLVLGKPIQVVTDRVLFFDGASLAAGVEVVTLPPETGPF